MLKTENLFNYKLSCFTETLVVLLRSYFIINLYERAKAVDESRGRDHAVFLADGPLYRDRYHL